ncbi:AAA domain, dynein subfamily protein (macronuclear) [Tetrahymena thermophila SB210]|uniref:AAA domain, dynein subfamily protein n=1 Tax=Tetrahymena thermophila (strain SB210) TaxID=312017 RepID=Q22SD8_TETTS|nr:AAA domain, dynein subfamily protein [Tetrahymena thermophila SB210]EAR87834.2 AAA domain, dynein subfamily protein [Tetrahymena thermophila SB210]|eukprot:XP_001008079.2 AAA domain, dynein subfamily protein [Tetrahymena thermophila SB210]
MTQMTELHEDIFYTQLKTSRKTLSEEIKYNYIVKGIQELETKEIKRKLLAFIIKREDQSSSAMIFDTPSEFYEKQNVFINLISDKNIILKQIDPINSLLMFLQANSAIDQIKGLFKFTKTVGFINYNQLLKQSSDKLYRLMKNVQNVGEYQKKMKILEKFYKQEKYKEVFQDLSNLYKQNKLNYDNVEIEEKEEIENLCQRFSFYDWIDAFFDDSSILNPQMILQGLHQKLEESSLPVLNSIKIEKIIKFKHQNNQINQNKASFIQRYWIKRFQNINDNEKLDLLIKNSDLIIESFSSCSKQEFQNFINDFFSVMVKSDYLFQIFQNSIQQFIDKYDKKGDLIQQYFTNANFSRLKENIQISLFICLYEKKIVLNVDLQEMLFKAGTSQISIESIIKVFSLLISDNPQLIYIQPLYNIFKSQCSQLNSQESFKVIKYKIQLLSLAQQQLEILQKSNQINNQQQIESSQLEINIMGNNQNKNNDNKHQVLNEEDILQLSYQMDEIIIKKLVILSTEQLCNLISSLNKKEEFQCLQMLIKTIISEQLESMKSSDLKFIDQFNKVFSCYQSLIKIQKNEKVLMKIVYSEFEDHALKKYEKSKQINNHFLEEFAYQIINLKLSDRIYNQVLQDLQNFSKFDISMIDKLFNSKVFFNIFTYLEKNIGTNYQQFKQFVYQKIQIYRDERQKLIKFFERTKPYLEEDYKNFLNQFKTNQIFEKLDETLCQFKHLQYMYELLNMFQSSVIFNKIFLIVEEKQGDVPKTQDSLKLIFEKIKQNFIQFTQILIPNENNQHVLQEFEFQNANKENQNSQISIIIVQNIQQSQNKFEIFVGNIITFTQLQHLCGTTFQESFKNIQYSLNLLRANYSPQLLEQLLKNVYTAQFFFRYGQKFINLSQIYKVDLSSRPSNQLKLQLNNLLSMKKLEDMSIQQIANQQDAFGLKELSSALLGEDSFQEQVELLEKLEVILQYKNNNLKLSSFLDLRDLVDEDSTDIISLLIKLNNYNDLLGMISDYKKAMENKPLLQFIKETFQFIKQNMNRSQIVIDLNDCVNDFDKIQNISQTFDKKKQFISLTCQIIEEGQFALVFDEKDSNITVKIQCEKEYSEIEMRQICSKIILEQTTKTNNLIAAAQANIQKQCKKQNRYQNKTVHTREERDFLSYLSKNKFNPQDDINIQINSLQKDTDEEELEKEIEKLKLKMQKFRDQWFEIEQIKEIILNSIKYGCYSFLKKNLSYDNRNGQYQSTYIKMKEDVKAFQKNLDSWQSQMQQAFKQYPQLTLIGFFHFREIMKCLRRQILSFSPDLKGILQQIGVEENELAQINSNNNILDDNNMIIEIGKFLSKKLITSPQLFGSQGKKIFQIKCQGSQIIEILVQRIKQSASHVQYYQCFYYDTHSTIQDLELFMYRFQYLSLNPSGNEYFLILNKKLDMNFFNQLNEILQQLHLKQDKGQNSLYILANKDIIQEEIIMIPYLSVDQILEPEKNIVDFSSNQFRNAKKYINFIYSDYPGAGKTFQIHQNNGLIRVPTNGSSNKIDFIQLLRVKLNDKNTNAQYSIHLDMYEMPELDLNYLLFELIFFNSLSIHSKKYVYIGNQVNYYIEIQNSLNHEFLKNLNIKNYFNQKKIDFNIQQYQIQHHDLTQEECIYQFMCYKYLSVMQANQRYQNYLDKTNLSNQNYKKNDQSYKNDFQNLLQTFFISKIQQQNIQPCFYKLSHFVKLFGSEMNKFEKCYFVEFGLLQQNSPDLLNLGLRTYILTTSYNLCLAVSVNKINKLNLIEGSNLTKAQQLHNKAQSIEKFNSNMMNFVTFQEQENPCITTFFDKQQQVPKCISQLFEQQKENMIFFDQQNRPEALLKWLIMLIHQNVSNMYGDTRSIEFTNILHNNLQNLVQRITIQKDNFFKIAMIFMRIRSNTPVIIMGQSGIGKTALIELMSLIMDAIFITMNIHAGITERDVINKINEIQTKYNSSQKIILFFDEVNTNKLIGGLFKEILVDRCIKGQTIRKNIIPIAAINPYKLKSLKQQQMINLQIHGGIKKDLVDKIKNTDLEYMVEPIPESMYNFIWNFDSLDKQDERNYITQMLILMNQIKLKKRAYQTHQFKKEQLQQVSEAVFFAQETIRQEMGYQSACSLRDVSRFSKILFWFIKNLQIFQSYGLKIPSITDYAICLSFFINYAVRLPLIEQRQTFLTNCAQKLSIKANNLFQIIHEVLTYLTDQTEVPQGIVKNSALKSNIFTLFVCIMNKIPIVLIGPPGCSKSLSIGILVKTMKGEQSKSLFFKKYKTIMQLFYQGHIQSTSERIQEVFENAMQKQNKIIEQKQSKKYLSLVQIEEIGLAEISPHNPLKVLHSVLEKPKISVACISNWPLDQSKMNRMLAVYRLNINENELNETIQCIQIQMIENQKDVFVKERLKKNALSEQTMGVISKIYLKYLELLKKIESGKYEQFHGLRDFYSMAKLICYKQIFIFQKDLFDDNNKNMVNSNQLIERIIISFARHFSGLKVSKQLIRQAVETIYPQTQKFNAFQNMLSDLNLIDENLNENTDHYLSRNLMIITENPQFATDYISRRLTALKRPYKLLLGGDFSQDQSTENSYSIINQIISCVESGIAVVLQNLDNIYQSLYELLNQNFRELNGKPYCKISFGADSSNIQIGKGFKLILIQQMSQIHRMDGPLLNRFEKHMFDEGMTLDQKGNKVKEDVYEYFKQLVEQFTFQNFQDAIQTLVIQQREINQQSENIDLSLENDQIIQILYRLIPLSRSLSYINEKDKIFKQKFFDSKYYFSLEEFIKRRILDVQYRFENINNSNLITIYSPSFCISTKLPQVKKRIQLQEIESQQKLVDTLSQFFKEELDSYNLQQMQFEDHGAKIILVVTDMLTDTYDRLVLVRQKITEAFIYMQKQLPQEISKNYFAVVTVKTHDQFSILPFQNIWEQYYLEDLFPLNFIPIKYIELKEQFNVQMLLEKRSENLLNVVNLEKFMDYFVTVQENITNSYTLIEYKQINREKYRTIRLSQLWGIFKNQKLQQIVSLFMQVAQARIRDRLSVLGVQTVDDFLQKCVLQKKFIQQRQSLSKAFWLGFNEIAYQGLALVIFVLEKYNLLNMIYDQSNNNQALKVIQNKLFEIFDLSVKHFDAATGIYKEQIKFNNFENTNRFEVDTDKLDLQFYESEKIYSIINSIIANVDLSINGITQNEQQETSKLNKFQEICSQIKKSLQQLCKQSDLEACASLNELFLNDFYKYLKQNITQYQKNILIWLLHSPQFNLNKNNLEQVIQQTAFCYFYSSDLVKIENIMSQFEPFLSVQKIMEENINQNNNPANIRNFLRYLVSKIYQSIQPSKQVFQIVKLNKIDYEQIISQLVQFIDLYQLQVKQEDILKIKQELLLLSCFIEEIIKGLSVNLKILNFINLEFFQNLEELYLHDLKIQLKNLYQLDLSMQSEILSEKEFEFPADLFNQDNKQTDFELKWNKFLLEIIYSAIKCREREYCPDFTKQLFTIVGQIESFYVNNNQEFPTNILIKFNLIMNELSFSIKSEEKLVNIFQTDLQKRLIEIQSTEYRYMVIFSNAIQQNIIKNSITTISSSQYLLPILYNCQLKDLTQMQKLIYMAVFRHVVQHLIGLINKNVTQYRQIDYDLKQFFTNMTDSNLQLYLAKSFYNQYKQGDIMQQKMNLSPYFKDCTWLKQISKAFQGLLSSSFLSEVQMKDYKEFFENKNDHIKNILKVYLEKKLKQSQNVFGNIFNGILNKNSHYPFMMYNNIYLFHRDSQRNTQLYQCINCKEYIFSDACPHLKSVYPCLQCGKLIQLGNQNTTQVLTEAHKKPDQLENIKINNQWTGFYIKLEDDMPTFKLDQGTSLDFRIFALIYYYSLLLAFQLNKKYNSSVSMQVYNMKSQGEISVQTKEINRNLRIHYEADPVKYMNEQIDIALNHITSNMKQMYNLSESEQTIILFKIINELITNNQIKECNQQQRASLNSQFSQQIIAIIKKSQQVILNSKCEQVPVILEKDNPNDNQISQNYLRNLRATELNLSSSFIQSYIKQNSKNDELKILKEFLDLPKFEYLSKSLKSFVYFTQQINSLFIKKFTKKKAQEITLFEALGNQKNHSLYKYYTEQIIPNWKDIKEREIEYQIGCQSHQIQQITEKTKLSDLLFTGDKQFGQFPNVLELLVNQQNNFINKIYQLVKLEKLEEFPRLKKLVYNILIDHSSKEQDKLNELPIQNIDCSKNIMKSFDGNIYMLYFLSNLEYGRGFSYIFDFRLLQEELIEQVLDGAVQINLESSQKFFFLSEINQIGLLSNNLIEQEQISQQMKNRIQGLFQNKTQVYELLQQLSTVFQMFKSEKNQGNLSIDSALSQLQIRQQDIKIKQCLEDLKLVHLNDIIKCLEEMNMDELVELCNPAYQIVITEKELQPIISFIDKSVTLINFKIALGRFILRCLSQDNENISPKGSLFEQIFYLDIYEELWNDTTNVEAQYENAMKHKVTIGQSYHVYKHIRNKLNIKNQQFSSIFQIKQDAPKNSNKNQNMMMMDNFSDDVYKKNIKDIYK